MQWEVPQFLNTDPSYNFLETETKITNPSPKSESRGNNGYYNMHSIFSCNSIIKCHQLSAIVIKGHQQVSRSVSTLQTPQDLGK